jgi:hypothetical protein
MLGTKEGQNVLYVDGRVQFSATSFVGPRRGADNQPDCIYTIEANNNLPAPDGTGGATAHLQNDGSGAKNPMWTVDAKDQMLLPWAIRVP